MVNDNGITPEVINNNERREKKKIILLQKKKEKEKTCLAAGFLDCRESTGKTNKASILRVKYIRV
jgi:hypothetical protein